MAGTEVIHFPRGVQLPRHRSFAARFRSEPLARPPPQSTELAVPRVLDSSQQERALHSASIRMCGSRSEFILARTTAKHAAPMTN